MSAEKSVWPVLIQQIFLLCLMRTSMADTVRRYDPKLLVQGDLIRAPHRNAYKYSSRWTDGVVPYEIEPSLSENHVRVIKQAMENYQRHTCIRFVPRTEKHKDYLLFMNGGEGSCYSNLGRIGGRQNLSLGKGCDDFAIALHEIGHALGFDHEHVRPDRDDYITVIWENVDPSFRFAYEKVKPSDYDLQGLRYDYLSILHYSGMYYKRVIETRDPIYQDKIGNARNLSLCDQEKINRWYSCKDKIQPNNPCADKTVTTAQPRTSTPSYQLSTGNSVTSECKDTATFSCAEFIKLNSYACRIIKVIKSKCKKSCNLC